MNDVLKHLLKVALLCSLLLVGVNGARAQVSVGIRIGPPPTPRVVEVLRIAATEEGLLLSRRTGLIPIFVKVLSILFPRPICAFF